MSFIKLGIDRMCVSFIMCIEFGFWVIGDSSGKGNVFAWGIGDRSVEEIVGLVGVKCECIMLCCYVCVWGGYISRTVSTPVGAKRYC